MYNICTAFRKRSACLVPSVKEVLAKSPLWKSPLWPSLLRLFDYIGKKKTTHKNPKLFQTEENTWGKEESYNELVYF